jgi:hypothetical protein
MNELRDSRLATDALRNLIVGAIVAAAVLIPISPAWAAPGRGPSLSFAMHKHFGPHGEIDVNRCPDKAQPGTATCFARERIDSTAESLTPARERGLKAVAGNGATSSGTTSADAAVGDNGAYSPAYLQSAYNAPSGNPGETVAIVDAFDDSRAESDLAYYRSYYGLPPCTTANGCFSKVDQRGGTNYPQGDQAWGFEISLDLDMVSAICPNCQILLVEADSNYTPDLGAAVKEAAGLGASVISNSYGGGEYSGEVSDNAQYYDHPGVTIVASSGDGGYGTQFPAAAPNVVAVGGTSLYQATDAGTRNATETAWRGSGSGCSVYFAKPSWQHDTGCARRSIADVSAVADPNTGVWVWDTYPNGGGWGIFGGTSVAAPIVAGLYALAGNPGGSATEMPSTLYGDPGDLNDVTSGSNGTCAIAYLCDAGTGYDGPTGLGTPTAITPFLLSSAPLQPTVSIASPANGATVSGPVAVSASASDNVGVSRVEFSVDGALQATSTSAPYGWSWDASSVSAGSHTITATAIDNAGNRASTQISVNVVHDTTPPSIPSGVKLAVAGTGQVAIYWTPSTDNVGVVGYDLYRDGVKISR